MNDPNIPAMSVIITTPDRFASIRQTVGKLHAQSVRARLELVIVAPAATNLGLDEAAVKGFHGWQVVEVGPIRSTGEAIAAGVRRAAAPVVAIAEEHSYPEPGWAAALLEAHRGPWAAVGAVLRNANPGSATSWSTFLTCFGPFQEPVVRGEVNHLPGHNTSYKRDMLLEFGTDLEQLLNFEEFLQAELRAKGHRLLLEPAARCRHINVSRPLSLMWFEYHCGRAFADQRARRGRWSLARRLLHIVCGPLVPAVRLRRMLRHVGKGGSRHGMLRWILLPLLLGLSANALGEVVGYIFGPGSAVRAKVSLELQKYRYLTAQDLELLGLSASPDGFHFGLHALRAEEPTAAGPG